MWWGRAVILKPHSAVVICSWTVGLKGSVLYVLADLPGSLEDQRDPVHLFHLGHPESDSKERMNRELCHPCRLLLQLLDWKNVGQQRTRMEEIPTCGPGGPWAPLFPSGPGAPWNISQEGTELPVRQFKKPQSLVHCFLKAYHLRMTHCGSPAPILTFDTACGKSTDGGQFTKARECY